MRSDKQKSARTEAIGRGCIEDSVKRKSEIDTERREVWNEDKNAEIMKECEKCPQGKK